MSVGVVYGSEEFPERWGPDAGVVEFVPQAPPYDTNRPPVRLDNLERSVRVSGLVMYLARVYSNN